MIVFVKAIFKSHFSYLLKWFCRTIVPRLPEKVLKILPFVDRFSDDTNTDRKNQAIMKSLLSGKDKFTLMRTVENSQK